MLQVSGSSYFRPLYAWKAILNLLTRALSSKLSRASFVMIAFCCIAIWLSDEESDTPKDVATILFQNAEPIAIASAAVVFLLDSSDRRKAEQYEAWQVVNSALGQTGSGGRIQALEDLNRDRVDLAGIAIPRADLSGVNLERGKLERANCEGAQLDSANLHGANLRSADLRNTNLRHTNLTSATLWEANLRNAVLRKTSLRGASLIRADLRNADLDSADLRNADLDSADLRGANLLRADLRCANLHGANLSLMPNIKEKQLETVKLCRTQLPKDINLDPNRDCGWSPKHMSHG